ncbi:MAG: hypothetical protein IJV37_03685 [Bacteroidales bacterium]|nr:hypothetical protein [Bacteroidales bacterium]
MNKKFIYILASLTAVVSLNSCVEKLGTAPGTDTLPVVTPYNYAPSSEYDADTDQRVRFVNNGKATQAYFLVEKTADKKALIDSQGEEAYIQRVMSQGTALSFTDGVAEVVVTDMPGDYDISVAASDGSQKTLRSTSFSGIAWDSESGISGSYYPGLARIKGIVGDGPFEAELQRHQTDEHLFRIKGAFGPGTKLTIQTIDKKGEDEDGEYTFFRIPAQALPFTWGNYGTVSCRDVGYWQGDDAWVLSNGYESGMYADGSCFLMIQYYVSAGNMGYGYDFFVAD